MIGVSFSPVKAVKLPRATGQVFSGEPGQILKGVPMEGSGLTGLMVKISNLC